MRRRRAFVTGTVSLLLLSACTDTAKPKATASSAFNPFSVAASHSGVPAPSISALTVGQCFDTDDFSPGSTIDIQGVHLVDCAVPHQHEVYAVLAGPTSTSFPGDAALGAYASDQCLTAFTPALGIDYQGSMFDFAPIAPNAAAWARGEHTVVCAVYDSGFGLLTGAVVTTTSLAPKDG